jgi:ribose transport system substrate-binding protein
MRLTKIALVVAMVAFAVAAALTGHPVKAATTFTIGVSNSFVGSEWRTQMLDNMANVVKELAGKGIEVKLVIESADTDPKGQIQQIQNLVSKKVQAIIINPGDGGLNATLEEGSKSTDLGHPG